jgi:hypothetical protein
MEPRLRRLHRLAVAALLVGAAGALHAAGLVDVHFVEPARYADAGRTPAERERTLKVLGEHLKQLGARLPDGQRLRVDVLDIDLAGTLEPRRAVEVRVLRGRADVPAMTLRWTLSEGSRTLKSGEERITDLDYLERGGRLPPAGDLAYDRALLDRWFAERVAPAP